MDVAAALHDLLTLEARISALDGRRKTLRAELEAEALRQADSSGAAPTWRVKNLGSLILVVPDPKPVVIDDNTFTDWATTRGYLIVRRVDPATTKTILEQSHTDGDRVISADGELVAGAISHTRPPYLTVRLEKDAKAAAAAELEAET